MSMRWTSEEKRRLHNLFIQENLPIADIAQRLGRSAASVNTALTVLRIPCQRSARTFRMADDSIKSAWLRAFFDDEAHFDPQGRIRARSVNRRGLEQAAEMLRRFVPCHLTPRHGLYPDGSCYLVVLKRWRAEFLQLIGSTKFKNDTM